MPGLLAINDHQVSNVAVGPLKQEFTLRKFLSVSSFAKTVGTKQQQARQIAKSFFISRYSLLLKSSALISEIFNSYTRPA
jgi:hypothetical protein